MQSSFILPLISKHFQVNLKHLRNLLRRMCYILHFFNCFISFFSNDFVLILPKFWLQHDIYNVGIWFHKCRFWHFLFPSYFGKDILLILFEILQNSSTLCLKISCFFALRQYFHLFKECNVVEITTGSYS